MTTEQWEEKLKGEGYNQVVTHIDSPNKHYEMHEHPVDTAHIILTGMMDVEMNGEKRTYRPGDRLDVAKHVDHECMMGPNGCTFLTAIKM